MHGRNFYHRDLKMENIGLSGEGGVIKLIDFGSSTSVANGSTASAADEAKAFRRAEEAKRAGEPEKKGAAMLARDKFLRESQSMHVRAPELMLGTKLGTSVTEQEKVRYMVLSARIQRRAKRLCALLPSPAHSTAHGARQLLRTD